MSRIPRTFIEETTPSIARMRSKKLKAAILHSGGPAPGGNRVLAGAAKQFLDRGIQVIGFINGYEFLNETSIESIEKNVHYVEIDKNTTSQAIDISGFILRTARANPGKDIHKPEDLNDPEKTKTLTNVLEIFEYLRIGVLISIGGDDTLKTANYIYELAQRNLKENKNMLFQGAVIHVPKTIDNDYYGIPWTFGFFTAAEAAGRIVRGMYDDAKATNCYHVVELMGRKAGWYTAAASIFARGTRAIIPEDFEGDTSFSLKMLAQHLMDDVVLKREKNKKEYGIFCIAEGLVEKLPQEEKEKMEKDRFGNIRLAEAKIGEQLAKELEKVYQKRTGKKKSFKSQLVGYETRQKPASLYDALLTSQLGVGAYRLFENGRLGEMVTVRDDLEIDGIPFAELIDPETLTVRNRNIDLNGDFYHLLRSLEENFSK